MAKDLLASQEGLCFMELVMELLKYLFKVLCLGRNKNDCFLLQPLVQLFA